MAQAAGVPAHELAIAAATGAVFGLLGYFLTRHITAAIEKAL